MTTEDTEVHIAGLRPSHPQPHVCICTPMPTPHGVRPMVCGYTRGRGRMQPPVHTEGSRIQYVYAPCHTSDYVDGWSPKHMETETDKDAGTYLRHTYFPAVTMRTWTGMCSPLKKGLPSPEALFSLPPRTWRSWRGEDRGQEWLEGDHSACRPPPLWKQLENHKERSFQDPCRASLELPSPKSPC